jgi:hypothetical protein
VNAFPSLPFIHPGLTLLIAAIVGLFQLIIAIAFAVAVSRDANERLYRQQLLVFVGPFMWALATFGTGGLIGGGVYWLLHHSTLSKPTALA